MNWFVIMVLGVVIAGVIGDSYTSKKKHDLKKLELELKLEQAKAENIERETKLMRAQLDYEKQQLLSYDDKNK